MTTEKPQSLLREPVLAFVGATATVAVLWLVAVLAVNVLASPPADRTLSRSKEVVLLPGGTRGEIRPKGVPRLSSLHSIGGNPVDLTAWHTIVQCMILVALAALVVASIDRIRRKTRQRLRT